MRWFTAGGQFEACPGMHRRNMFMTHVLSQFRFTLAWEEMRRRVAVPIPVRVERHVGVVSMLHLPSRHAFGRRQSSLGLIN
jgi:hypothetical protein